MFINQSFSQIGDGCIRTHFTRMLSNLPHFMSENLSQFEAPYRRFNNEYDQQRYQMDYYTHHGEYGNHSPEPYRDSYSIRNNHRYAGYNDPYKLQTNIHGSNTQRYYNLDNLRYPISNNAFRGSDGSDDNYSLEDYIPTPNNARTYRGGLIEIRNDYYSEERASEREDYRTSSGNREVEMRRNNYSPDQQTSQRQRTNRFPQKYRNNWNNKCFNGSNRGNRFKKNQNYRNNNRNKRNFYPDNARKPLFCCLYCDNKFETLNQVIAHEKNHQNTTNGNIQPQFKKVNTQPNKVVKNEEPDEVCNSLQFVKGVSFHSTPRFHDIKSYKCPDCPKRFESNEELNRHSLIHTPIINQFICDNCQSKFVSETQLRYHMKSHIESNNNNSTVDNKDMKKILKYTII